MTATLEPGQTFGGDFRIAERAFGEDDGDATARARFLEGARVGAKIESEHVIEVVAAGVDEGTAAPWLATELLEGEDLAALVSARGALPPGEARELLAQLGHALAAAHAAGIAHGALAPARVFVARAREQGLRFKVKVLDFGVGRLLPETEADVGWRAPESEPGLPDDVWTLGLLAFWLLTGRPYWRAANPPSVSSAKLRREIADAPIGLASARAAELGAAVEVPPGFDAWFAKCVAREPDARFADAAAAHAALDELLARAPALGARPAGSGSSGRVLARVGSLSALSRRSVGSGAASTRSASSRRGIRRTRRASQPPDSSSPRSASRSRSTPT